MTSLISSHVKTSNLSSHVKTSCFHSERNPCNSLKFMKCDHRSESQFKQLRKSPKKDFGASTGFEPVASALALQ